MSSKETPPEDFGASHCYAFVPNKYQYLYCPPDHIPMGPLWPNYNTVATKPIVFDDLWKNGCVFSVRKAGSEDKIFVVTDPNDLNAVIKVLGSATPTAENKDAMPTISCTSYCGRIVNGCYYEIEKIPPNQ